MIFIVIILIIAVTVLGVMFYFMEKRQAALDSQTAQKFGEIQTELETIRKNSQTLRENDDILAKDIETLLHEFKKFQKKVNRDA